MPSHSRSDRNREIRQDRRELRGDRPERRRDYRAGRVDEVKEDRQVFDRPACAQRVRDGKVDGRGRVDSGDLG